MKPKEALILMGKILVLIVWLAVAIIAMSGAISYGIHNDGITVVCGILSCAVNVACIAWLFVKKWKML